METDAEVAVGGDDPLLAVERPGDDLPSAGSTIAAPPFPNTSRPAGIGIRKSAEKALAGMYCGTETTNVPDSIAIWRK